MSLRSVFGLAVALAACAFGLPDAAPALDDESVGFEVTPPRLSFADGTVSFLRPGADDWTPARVNRAAALLRTGRWDEAEADYRALLAAPDLDAKEKAKFERQLAWIAEQRSEMEREAAPDGGRR